MKTSIIKLFVIVAFLISIGIASSPALAELVTVTSGDVLEIRFDVPVLPSPDAPSFDTDVFHIFATESTSTGYFEAVTDIFIKDPRNANDVF